MAILGTCKAFRTFNGGPASTLMNVSSSSAYFDISNKLPGGSSVPYGNALLFVNTGSADIAFTLGVDTSVFVAPYRGWIVEAGKTLLIDEFEPAITLATYIAAMTVNHGSSTAMIMRGTTSRFQVWFDDTMTLNPVDPVSGNNNALLGPYYAHGIPSSL